MCPFKVHSLIVFNIFRVVDPLPKYMEHFFQPKEKLYTREWSLSTLLSILRNY